MKNSQQTPEKIMEGTEFEHAVTNRKTARKMIENAASAGDGIAGALLGLEALASPFYLGLDYNDELPNEDDVRPY